jgi:ribonucleotide monophosphatase NagD (HAD superfamily)
MGLPADPSRIFTAPLAARQHLLARGIRRAHFLVRESLREDFEGIEAADSGAEAVVLGDLGEAMTYGHLNRAFRLLLEGAELVALARNRYWRGADGLMLDSGPFVAALEHASGTSATLVGKPSPAFLRRRGRVARASRRPTPCAWATTSSRRGRGAVGRHPRHPGQDGKVSAFRPRRSPVVPYRVLDSLADLPELL